MAKKIDNTYIPKFVPNNLPWYERDGLNTWYKQNKCNNFLEDPDKNFENLQINNFDLIFNKEKLDSQKIEQYHTIDHKEIVRYPKKEREQIMSCIFRNVKQKDMVIQKETLHEYFKVTSKSVGRGRFFKKNKDDHYKETW